MYRLRHDGAVERISDGAIIPNNPLLGAWGDYQNWVLQGNNPEAATAKQVTIDDIIKERSRRLSSGFDYNFGDARGVHRIGTKPDDLIGWGEVAQFAGALLNSGDVTTTINIVTDTGPCQITAPEWFAIALAAAQFRQPIWARSFVLQQTLPTDFTADAHWS
jgi:hypothetical protein